MSAPNTSTRLYLGIGSREGFDRAARIVGKRCLRCGAVMPLARYARNRANADGRQAYCPTCMAELNRGYNADPEKMRVYRRRWYARHFSEWVGRDREKAKAEAAVHRAVARGDLVRQPCAVCGDPNTVGHHDSYAREDWLKVRWLCRQHHSAEHRRTRAATKAAIVVSGGQG